MRKSGRWADMAAVALSVACMLHCLALPLVASLLPVLAAEQGGWVHWLFVVLAAPAAIAGLHSRHAAPGSPEAALEAGLQASAACGVLLLVWGAARWPLAAWGTPLTVAGALVLATVHVINALTQPHCPHPHGS